MAFRPLDLLVLALLASLVAAGPLPTFGEDGYGLAKYRVLKRRDGMALPAAAVIGKRFRRGLPTLSSLSSSTTSTVPALATVAVRQDLVQPGAEMGRAMAERPDSLAIQAIQAGYVAASPIAGQSYFPSSFASSSSDDGSTGSDPSSGSADGTIGGQVPDQGQPVAAAQTGKIAAAVTQAVQLPVASVTLAPAPSDLTVPAPAPTGTAAVATTVGTNAAGTSSPAVKAIASGSGAAAAASGSGTASAATVTGSGALTSAGPTSANSASSLVSPSLSSSSSAAPSSSSSAPTSASPSSMTASASSSTSASATAAPAFSLSGAFKSSSPFYPFAVAVVVLTSLAGALGIIWLLKCVAHRRPSDASGSGRGRDSYPTGVPWVPRSHSEALLTPPLGANGTAGSAGTKFSSFRSGAGKTRWAGMTWSRKVVRDEDAPRSREGDGTMDKWIRFDPCEAPDAHPISIPPPAFSHPFAVTASPGLRLTRPPSVPPSKRSSFSEFGAMGPRRVSGAAPAHPPALIPGSMTPTPVSRPRMVSEMGERGSAQVIDSFLRELGVVEGTDQRRASTVVGEGTGMTGAVRARAGMRHVTQ